MTPIGKIIKHKDLGLYVVRQYCKDFSTNIETVMIQKYRTDQFYTLTLEQFLEQGIFTEATYSDLLSTLLVE